MRRILNFFVTMLILFLASRWFPAHVQIDGFGALALTTLLLWLVGTLVALAFTGVMVPSSLNSILSTQTERFLSNFGEYWL